MGGAERSLIELIYQLISSYHHQCTVILPEDGLSVGRLEAVGADTIIAPIHWWCDGFNLPDPQEQARLNAESFCWVLENRPRLQTINPDVVLTNTMVIPWGGVAAALLKRPHLWMVNEFGEADHGFKFFYPFERILALIDQASDKIITRSNAIRHALFPELSDDKTHTIYWHIPQPQTLSQEVDAKLEIFQNTAAYRLIITGTIMPTKGQEDAVHGVIELVKTRGREVALLMVGHGDPVYVQHLLSLINREEMNDRIQIIPFQENVLPLVAQADAVLVCSRMEALGRVVVEGLLMKKPVITTNTGGIPEIIKDGETGLLYAPGDQIQLADQIEKLIDDHTFGEQLAQNGWRFASQTFTEAAFGGAFHQVITDLAQQGCCPKDDFQDFIDELTRQALIHKINIEKKLLEKIAQLEQEAVSYAASKSWRLTRPFRKIKTLFRSKSGD